MHLHEYQAKSLLEKYGISSLPFQLVHTADQVDEALKALGTEEVVLKVQIHAGGRGKAGGVKLAHSKEEAREAAQQLLGMKIVNAQTGPLGVIAEKVLISPLCNFSHEYYLGVVIDRAQAEVILIGAKEGGMEIEELAKQSPEKLIKRPIDLDGTLSTLAVEEIADFMGWGSSCRQTGIAICRNLVRAFIDLDASLVEINPLVLTQGEALVPLDAKLSIDDNALFRHQEIAKEYDDHQLNSLEALARRYHLAYVALDGNIGCMVNGAGLAMATMDMIQYCGGSPANFLDVGGGASQEQVALSFKMILHDPKVKAILVNIFGGIMNCATLAKGIIAAAHEVRFNLPLIVRMEGTHVEEGKALLAQSNLKIHVAETFREAAEMSVKYGNLSQ